MRVEIPPTGNRWEANYVAPRFPLGRGWLRQLESDDRDLFTDGNLTAAAYRSWLDEHGVSYVAVADAELDYLAEDEAALIRGGLPYLRAIWSDEDWRLYRVEDATGLVSRLDDPDRAAPDDRLTALGPASFTISAREPGSFARPRALYALLDGDRRRSVPRAPRRLDRGRRWARGDDQRRCQVRARPPART